MKENDTRKQLGFAISNFGTKKEERSKRLEGR